MKVTIEMACSINGYIAPNDDLEGNSSLIFIQCLFYNLINYNLLDSFNKANNYDDETKLYKLYNN